MLMKRYNMLMKRYKTLMKRFNMLMKRYNMRMKRYNMLMKRCKMMKKRCKMLTKRFNMLLFTHGGICTVGCWEAFADLICLLFADGGIQLAVGSPSLIGGSPFASVPRVVSHLLMEGYPLPITHLPIFSWSDDISYIMEGSHF